MKTYKLEWCYTRDLHRKDDLGVTRKEEYPTKEMRDSRWANLSRWCGGRVKRLA